MPPDSTVHHAATIHLLFDALMILLQFFVSSKFVLVIAFSFVFFAISLVLSIYKPQSCSVQRGSIDQSIKID